MSGNRASPTHGENAADISQAYGRKSQQSGLTGHSLSPIKQYQGIMTLQHTAGNQAVSQLINGGGRPLDPDTRTFMESRFSANFSRVRVHHGASAVKAAQQAHARALTLGNEVIFGAGQYAPWSIDGMQLLAHELTHVVQQQQAGHAAVQSRKWFSNAQDPAEREAERVSLRVAHGEQVTIHEQPGAVLQRMGLQYIPDEEEVGLLMAGSTIEHDEVVQVDAVPSTFPQLQQLHPDIAEMVERLSMGYRSLMVQLLPPLNASGVYNRGSLSAAHEKTNRDWIARKEQWIEHHKRYDASTLAGWIGVIDTNLSHFLPLVIREANQLAETDDFPELKQDLAAAQALRLELAALADQLEATDFIRAGQEQKRAAQRANADERRHAERKEEIIAKLKEMVRRSGHPNVPSIVAKMNASAVVHYLLDQQGLRSGKEVSEVFEQLRAEDPELLKGVLFLSHTLELLKQRGITGLDQYEGITFDYWAKTAEDILVGDFSDDPTGAAIAVRTLLTLIPGVDQVADVEDLSANVYKLVWEGRVNEFGVWFGLTVTLVGAVPGAGSAIKGVLKLGKKGLVFITPVAVKKLAGSIDVSTWSRQLAVKIREFIASQSTWQHPMISSFLDVLDQLERLLLPMRSVAAEEVGRMLKNLKAAREQASEMIEQQVTPILDTLQDVAMALSGEGRRVRLADEFDDDALRGATGGRSRAVGAFAGEATSEQLVMAGAQQRRTGAGAVSVGRLGGPSLGQSASEPARAIPMSPSQNAKVESFQFGGKGSQEQIPRPHQSEVELSASVKRSSKKESDQLDTQEVADEVTYVNKHPELIEGTPPDLKAKIGDHEIKKGPGRNCQRHSSSNKEMPCPILLASQENDPPHRLDVGNSIRFEEDELPILVRKIVLDVFEGLPIVEARRRVPPAQLTTITGAADIPAAALQAREHIAHRTPIHFFNLRNPAAWPTTVQIELDPLGAATVARARIFNTPVENVRNLGTGTGFYKTIRDTGIPGLRLSNEKIAEHIRTLIQRQRLDPSLNASQSEYIRHLTWLMFGTESSRNVGNIAYAPMLLDRIESGHTNWAKAFPGARTDLGIGPEFPMSLSNTPAAARQLEQQLSDRVENLVARQGGHGAREDDLLKLKAQEEDLTVKWVREMVPNASAGGKEAVEESIRTFLKTFYQIP